MLEESIKTAYIHYNRAKDNIDEIVQYSLNIETFDDKEKIKTIDAFIFRFVKLQDFMGDKLFKQLLIKIGEYKDNMALIDVLDKLEKFELISDADKWMDIREIRNKLTHEYPDNKDDIIEGLKLAIKYFGEIRQILENINIYIEKKELI